MYIQTILLSLTAVLATADATWAKREHQIPDADLETVTWTRAGARFRPISATFTPETITVTDEHTFRPSVTFHLRAVASPQAAKRADIDIETDLNAWTYKGCAVDNDKLPMMITPFSYQLNQTEVSSGTCVDFCGGRSYDFAAMQNGNECWCGMTSDAATVTYGEDNASCNVACSANEKEMCGGSAALTVYTKTL